MLGSRQVYQNPWMRVREDTVIRPDGSQGIYGVVEPDDNVAVVALTDDREVHLAGEYMYPLQTHAWKIPGGAVHAGESPLVAAKRELLEEMGITARDWTALGAFYMSGGISTQVSHLYLARGLDAARATPEGTEVIERALIPLDDAHAMCRDGTLKDAPTLVGIMRAAAYLGRPAPP